MYGDVAAAAVLVGLLIGCREMKKRRSFLIAFAVSFILFNGSCVSFHLRTRGHVVRPDGRPVDAFVLYWYRGDRFNPVCSSSYTRRGSLVRTEADGSFVIAGTIHFHLPYPLQTWTRLEAMVYSAETHSVRSFLLGKDLEQVVLDDHGGDPAKWREAAQIALLEAHTIASAKEAESPRHEVSEELQREFRSALREEWVLFREKFGALPFRPGDPRTWASFADRALRSLEALEAKSAR